MHINLININSKKTCTFTSEKQAPKTNNTDFTNPTTGKKEGINLPVLLTTAIGTLIPMLLISRHQSKNLAKKIHIFNFKYGLKEILLVSLGSITGGITGGILADKKNKKEKINEGLFNIMNILIQTSLSAGLVKLVEKSKKFNNNFAKIVAIVSSILIGMPTAAYLTNKITSLETKNKKAENRSIHPKDMIVHMDDIITAAIFMKLPLLNKIPMDKLLPVLYGFCGYGSGSKNKTNC